jgi:hypothetical protein
MGAPLALPSRITFSNAVLCWLVCSSAAAAAPYDDVNAKKQHG